MELKQYLDKMESEGRICLKGKYWDKAFTIATESNKRDNSILPNPLILTGWHYSDDEEKAERFKIHLNYCYEHGNWQQLLAYIEKLDDNAWHYKG